MTALAAGIVYLAILLTALLIPYASWGRSATAADRWIMGAIVGSALLLTGARHGSFMMLSLILLLPLATLGARALFGGIAAVLLFAPVTWWTTHVVMGLAATGTFILLALGANYLPRLGDATPANARRRTIVPAMAIAFMAGLGPGLLTAPFGAREPIQFAWHHWGAYLAPVEAWLAGGAPYRDFPVQYGMGPTTVLAIVCGSDCWSGIYYTTVVANALYFSVLAGCAVILTAGRSQGMRSLALAALFCATFMWTAFPMDVGSTVMTPSVAGLRFLPIAALLLQILIAESSGQRRDWIGHAIWLCDLFWSPEAAFFGTLIWWPYLAIRDAASAQTSRESWIALLRGAARGVLAFAAGMIVVAAAVWLLSAGAARPADFLAYILAPPGPLPINPAGTIWLALAVILLALHALVGTGRSTHGRILYACLLGFLAAGTYYLSRSHDNNILNLFPLMVILLLASVQSGGSDDARPAFADAFVRTVLAATVAFVTTANWSSWAEGAATEGARNIGPSRLIARFTPQLQDQPRMIPADALRGLAYLRSRNAGAVMFIDENKLIPWHAPGATWTGVNDVANYDPFSKAMITRYVCRGALAYNRSGWILVDEHDFAAWVPVFEAGYVVREQIPFGAYRAYHLSPRPGPLSCAGL
jgi:hypothetical protein